MIRYFSIGILVGAGIVVAALLLAANLVGGALDSQGYWPAGVIEKKTASANRIIGPKILLVGGSNVHFGYSAEHLQAAVGMPAVNMGSQVALGLRYLLHYSRRVIKPGDIVVLALEYQQYGDYSRKSFSAAPLVLQSLLHDREYFDSLSLLSRARIAASLSLSQWSRLIRCKLNPAIGQAHIKDYLRLKTFYDPSTTNEFGDETQNTNQIARSIPETLFRPSRRWAVHPEAVRVLRKFSSEIRAKGASVVIAFPNLYAPAGRLPENKAFFADLVRTAALLGLPVLGTPEEAFFDGGEMFDSTYHLTDSGRRRATERLARDLMNSGVLNGARSLAPPTK